MFGNLSIRQRLILGSMGLLVLAVGTLVPVMLDGMSGTIRRAEERQLTGYLDALTATIGQRTQTGIALSLLVARMPDAQRAFAAGDRTRLTEMFLPTFDVMKKEAGVEQFQFHSPPATSFLRLHMVKKFGDDLSSFRQTVVVANQERKAVQGLEKGVAGLGARAVVPVSEAGKHIGTVEFGMDFGPDLVNDFKARFGVDVAIHIQGKDGLKTIASTRQGATLMTEALLASVLGGEKLVRRAVFDGKPAAVLAAAIPDYAGKPAAVVELLMDATENEERLALVRTSALGIGLGVLIAGAAGAWFFANGIAKPLGAMTTAMGDLAGGRIDVTVPGTDRGDEIGRMAQAVAVFKEQARENRDLHGEQEEMARRVEKDRRTAIGRIADQIERTVGQASEAVSKVSEEMRQGATVLMGLVADADARAGAVTAAAGEASANIDTVAAAAEELSSSIGEISRRLTESAQISTQAVKEAESADRRILALDEAVKRIGEVAGLISDIAEQTNLLALNATIEAARAGDAGKGFAVVAGEVKALANQTAKATEEISGQIGAVEQATKATVDSIETIGSIIGRIDEAVAAIASAVEEQGAATQEIARNVNQAADGAHRVSSNIAEVTSLMHQADQAAHRSQATGEALAEQARSLRSGVDGAVREIRGA